MIADAANHHAIIMTGNTLKQPKDHMQVYYKVH